MWYVWCSTQKVSSSTIRASSWHVWKSSDKTNTHSEKSAEVTSLKIGMQNVNCEMIQKGCLHIQSACILQACKKKKKKRKSITFAGFFFCGVGKKWSREHMHAMLIEETQELCLLGFLQGIKQNGHVSLHSDKRQWKGTTHQIYIDF